MVNLQGWGEIGMCVCISTFSDNRVWKLVFSSWLEIIKPNLEETEEKWQKQSLKAAGRKDQWKLFFEHLGCSSQSLNEQGWDDIVQQESTLDTGVILGQRWSPWWVYQTILCWYAQHLIPLSWSWYHPDLLHFGHLQYVLQLILHFLSCSCFFLLLTFSSVPWAQFSVPLYFLI